MRPTVATRPPELGVRRQFEPQRFARANQARGYEAVLPMPGPAEAERMTAVCPDDGLEAESIAQEGVAA
jgi:hypothetical protein